MLKALYLFADVPDAGPQAIDVIEYQGTFWLVPQWLDMPERKVTRPARIIRLDALEYQDLRQHPDHVADFFLTDPIPRALWDGKVPIPAPGVVIENPPIELPIPGAAH